MKKNKKMNDLLFLAISNRWDSVSDFCCEHKLNPKNVWGLLRLEISPLIKGERKGHRPICKKISRILEMRLIDLFPQKLYGVEDKRQFEIVIKSGVTTITKGRNSRGHAKKRPVRIFTRWVDLEEYFAWHPGKKDEVMLIISKDRN